MKHAPSDILPFMSEQYGAHVFDDRRKAGRTPVQWDWWWVRVLHSDYTDADGSQALNLATIAAAAANQGRCSGALPTDAIIGYWAFDLRAVFAGGGNTAVTMIAGYSGDDNGYLTTTNVFTGASLGRKQTAGAALWTPQPSLGDPLLQCDTTTGTCLGLTAGCIDVYAQFCRNPASQYYTP